MAVYLDASAIVKTFVEEPETFALRRYLAGRTQRATSRLSWVEVPRALNRKPNSASTEMVEAGLAAMVVLELTPQVASLAATLDPPVLRSLDAIHLATARALGDECEAFVTYDVRLADAARSLGFTVVAPA